MIPSLYTALSGLSASQTQLDNVSNNVANENTPGYKKRTVHLNEVSHILSNDIGRGVSIGDVLRATSTYMYDNILTEGSKASYQKELSGLLGSVETIFKETETAGFSKSITNYFNSLTQLSIDKNDPIAINKYISQSNILVSELKNLYAGIEAKEQDMRETLSSDVDEVNRILKDIANINLEIEKSGVTNELLDSRDLLEQKLSEFMDIEVDRNEPYIITVGDERIMWNTHVREITTTEELKPQRDRYLDEDGNSTITLNPPMNADDKFEFTLNGVGTVEVEFGEFVTNSRGEPLDIDGDGVITDADRIDNTNYVRGLSVAINADPEMSKYVTAYNGDPTRDAQGNIIPPTLDTERFLNIQAKQPGVEGKFDTTLEFKRGDATTGLEERIEFEPDKKRSFEASNEVKLFAGGVEIEPNSGSILSKLENLTTNSGSNSFQSYKDMLDSFAFTLSDIHQSYAKTDDGYIYGEQALVGTGTTIHNEIKLNLFSGTSVKSLKFNEEAVKNLDQKDLDYLNTIKNKDDLTFNNNAQNPNASEGLSFSEFYRSLTVKISEDKAVSDFALESQQTINASLNNSYNKIVQVDKDEEMLNLVKFQAAYEANAKIVTIVDQMLQTLLGIKR